VIDVGIRNWLRRHRRITWFMIFAGIASLDLPFYYAYPWIATAGWRGLYYAMKFTSLLVAWYVADYVVKHRL